MCQQIHPEKGGAPLNFGIYYFSIKLEIFIFFLIFARALRDND